MIIILLCGSQTLMDGVGFGRHDGYKSGKPRHAFRFLHFNLSAGVGRVLSVVALLFDYYSGLNNC